MWVQKFKHFLMLIKEYVPFNNYIYFYNKHNILFDKYIYILYQIFKFYNHMNRGARATSCKSVEWWYRSRQRTIGARWN
jgi:hypothetical protein